jgi:high-affinity iron transporter
VSALFRVSSTSASGGQEVLIGGLVGLAIAIALGVGVYHGSRVIPMRLFFQVTGVLIILFAAGLLSRSVQFFQAAGDLGTVNNAAYDVTGAEWLTTSTESGKVLAGIFGWDPRPSAEQVLVYFGYLIPVLVAFFWSPRRRRPAAAPEQAQGVAASG